MVVNEIFGGGGKFEVSCLCGQSILLFQEMHATASPISLHSYFAFVIYVNTKLIL